MPPRNHPVDCRCIVCRRARRESFRAPRNHQPDCQCIVCRNARREETVAILVRIPLSVQEQIRQLMSAEECSQSELVRRALDEFLRRHPLVSPKNLKSR